MIVVVDNYDSFTFNLVQFIGELGAEPVVHRNDALSVDDVRRLDRRGIIISPGPGRPEDAGISIDLVRELGPQVPILGVCLGHQVIATAYGGRVDRAPEQVHGKTVRLRHDGAGIFEGVRSPFEAGRYHSLVAVADSIPDELRVTARTDDGLVMAFQHRAHPVYGVQFHPESILTDDGKVLLGNFLRVCGEIS